MTKTEQNLVLRNALANAIATAGTNVYKNLKDQTVQMYWKTCFELDFRATNERFISGIDVTEISSSELISISNFIYGIN